jgi:transcriptional regulator with XRE-family HTH domain
MITLGAQSLDLSRNIASLRALHGLKQSTVAERMNVHPTIPSLWESGKRLVPANRIRGLATALETDVETLLLGQNMPSCMFCHRPCNVGEEICAGCKEQATTQLAQLKADCGHASNLMSLLPPMDDHDETSWPAAVPPAPAPAAPPAVEPVRGSTVVLTWCTSSHGARDANHQLVPARRHHHGVRPASGPVVALAAWS